MKSSTLRKGTSVHLASARSAIQGQIMAAGSIESVARSSPSSQLSLPRLHPVRWRLPSSQTLMYLP